MKFILKKNIDRELQLNGRTYLTGKLEKENNLKYISTISEEIGISKYNSFKYDKAHLHKWNNEINYVIKGEIKVYIFEEEKEYYFSEGDLFYIEPNMPYMTKCNDGTEVIFFKVPGGNDKQEFDIQGNSSWINWTKKWD
ncbi:cupin domain-containing protein [Streptococcus parauberis]|uniref:cupin domain-containing protein n=1 Tax=Streptococcus parauberis TaxID=1348 RepID=UPI000CCE8152|nr:cupin domain-containing protein [Streptococcus parauberis]PNY20235.1 Cupin domain protein [Streptococcus parauberis]